MDVCTKNKIEIKSDIKSSERIKANSIQFVFWAWI